MTSGKSDIVDVTLEKRMIKGKAQAFYTGELDENNREVWVWLPLSQIEIAEINGNSIVEVSLPEWLAKDKGLI